VKTDIINAIGGFRSAFDGSQDYDLIFRCIEKAQSVHHIAKILYHWRMHAASTALNPESKMYCYEAGQKAIQEHYDRTGIEADVYMMPAPYYGNYHTVYRMKETPLVSVIIRNTGDVENLKRCIHSIRDFGSYKNIEVITVSQPETDAANEEGVKDVIWLEDPLKHSAMLNYGASFANGKYLLFVNDSAEMIKADSIREMAALLSREETGVIGAKLLNGDETVRHAGIIIGFDGYAENVFAGERRQSEGYVMRNLVNGNYSAVSGDCLMTKTSLFKELGGFDETFAKEAFDLDYCLRVREKQLLVTYCAFSEWYVKQDAETDSYDRNRFCEKWKETIPENDPYYNPCLALKGKPFRI
jgi:GT2 family glycosyltransferase